MSISLIIGIGLLFQKTCSLAWSNPYLSYLATCFFFVKYITKSVIFLHWPDNGLNESLLLLWETSLLLSCQCDQDAPEMKWWTAAHSLRIAPRAPRALLSRASPTTLCLKHPTEWNCGMKWSCVHTLISARWACPLFWYQQLHWGGAVPLLCQLLRQLVHLRLTTKIMCPKPLRNQASKTA